MIESIQKALTAAGIGDAEVDQLADGAVLVRVAAPASADPAQVAAGVIAALPHCRFVERSHAPRGEQLVVECVFAPSPNDGGVAWFAPGDRVELIQRGGDTPAVEAFVVAHADGSDGHGS